MPPVLMGFEVEFVSFKNRKIVYERLLSLFRKFRPVQQDNPSGTEWRVHSDSSIRYLRFLPHADWFPIEISSPAMPLPKALEALKVIFDYMERHSCVTNSSCGLHINLSFNDPNKINYLNRIKLISLLDEDRILQEFGRKHNQYCQPHSKTIIKLLRKRKKYRTDEAMLVSRSVNFLPHASFIRTDPKGGICYENYDKYSTINFRKLGASHPYLEFRLMGGKNYHRKFDQVEKNVLHFSNILTRACISEKDNRDWYSKLEQMSMKARYGKLWYLIRLRSFIKDLFITPEKVEEIRI